MTMEDLTTRRLCDTMQGHRDEGAHREVILLPAPSVKKPGRVETREGTRTSPPQPPAPGELGRTPKSELRRPPSGISGGRTSGKEGGREEESEAGNGGRGGEGHRGSFSA